MKKRARLEEIIVSLKSMAKECISDYLAMSIAIDHNMIDLIDIEEGEISIRDNI